ncbi:MBOAT family protein [Clostridium chromiireducens]|uniref:MBOAT family protein n=1 Tax=Clostridium chromiireducens TaxID=225345 RepID=A0A399II74_9CLOT|nr:MBOAT family O-acyltransferase [Clostridium chromiireducens]RII32713.1 MBOAT family protein [Clostridium chromiireducens]
MSFNSIHFFIFFPVVVLTYFIIPRKIRWIWLLLSSYYFYMSWNPKYSIVLAFSTMVTYLSGLLIDSSNSIKDKQVSKQLKNFWLFLSFIINLGILFFFKYYNFFSGLIITTSNFYQVNFSPPIFDILLPIGISFYTFQALSYTVDVYRGDIPCERNLGKYALFVSFFPQLVAGPIEKSKNLLHQFNQTYNFDYERVKNSLIRMLWGFFKKIFVADRLAILVNTVYNSPNDYFGFQIIIATIFYAFQIYADFSAYSDIAIGAANVMGFNLTTNFRQPYFSKSIKEFWKRWHITLGDWFRDYLYIPLGGNRKGKVRTYINIVIVFLISGLWHGASITFIIWGLLHGIYQVVGNLIMPVKNYVIKKFNIRTDVFSYKLSQVIITFILVDFAWMFFRANSFIDIKILLNNLFVFNPWILADGSLYDLGLNSKEFFMSIIGIVIILIVNISETRSNIINMLSAQNLLFRWTVYVTTVLTIVVFGVYGFQYSEQQFIYFQF